MASSVRLNEAIESYLASRKARGIKSGLASEKSTLLRFLSVVGNIYPRSIEPRHTDIWLEANAHWQPSTRQANINRMSSFQAWCYTRKLIPRGEDFLEGRRKVKVPRKRRQRIPRDQFSEMLDRAMAPRDRVIVAIGLFLLVRVSEMVTIKWGDVHEDAGLVDVYREKTGEPDELPVGPDLADELARWKREVCVRMGVTAPDPNWYVVCRMVMPGGRNASGHFVSNLGDRKLLPDVPLIQPRDRIKKIMAQLGVDEPGTGMHTLRRSGALALLEFLVTTEGRDQALLVVSSMLGHKTTAQTQVYVGWESTKLTRDKLIKAYRMLTPKAGGDVIELRQRK